MSSFSLCFNYHHSHCYDVIPSVGLQIVFPSVRKQLSGYILCWGFHRVSSYSPAFCLNMRLNEFLCKRLRKKSEIPTCMSCNLHGNDCDAKGLGCYTTDRSLLRCMFTQERTVLRFKHKVFLLCANHYTTVQPHKCTRSLYVSTGKLYIFCMPCLLSKSNISCLFLQSFGLCH